MNKPRIILDMDDVIANLLTSWIEVVNFCENENVQLQDVSSWDIEKYFKCGRKVFDYLNYDLYRNLKPIEGSQDGVRMLQEKYDVYIVTVSTTHKDSLIAKIEWLEEYFPFIKKEKIVLLGDKSIVRGDIIIDDSIKNLERFDGRKILFNSCHNQGNVQFERVNGWSEILDRLL
ncbi:5' nucleotidase, NT5C type [Lysinibacillus fusiformis]|uniref:5' nucleotidase, NT5C type n=1 Tax=Lysinibacillus fusiformis TaxID=28031 RepID=UPI00263B3701|nr:5'-3'-deoxyribonucleotidase [Lysinibacillus sphaericus]MDN4968309.1 5'-3'-deoxyribonucleotidase [Lysinibacillus fusiformis]MDN4968483.1 5'-3'-deoxyribonucleotidase [Lysinibacillus fusiformis]